MDRSGVRGRAGIGFVGSYFRGSRSFVHSLGHYARLARPLGHSFVGSARGSYLSLDYLWASLPSLLVGSFHVGCLLGIRSRDLTG